ncbi:MBL fold metallo-hydrolase [Candidatus Peregrinibacteria bacterium]|nr:MBL fold metallo-hydrolase [Candidatus Peregrinibacteria bacterium]
MKIKFCGAAGGVTGSQHMLTVNNKHILLDCGLFQGKRQEAMERNTHFDYDPHDIEAVVLSHAHIDHSGNIPYLIKRGFKGVVYCTEATKSLCDVMLLDSAHIQESDAAYYSRHCAEAIKPIQPLYTVADAKCALQCFKGYPYHKTFEVSEGVKVTFFDAGHVLGSAFVFLEIQEGKQKHHLFFTGDMGRRNLPILKDPETIREADILITEGTYGNREHDPIEEGMPALAHAINKTARRGGKVIIPVFALERTQEIIYGLHRLRETNYIVDIPIFIDSPLASSITNIFAQYKECYDEDLQSAFRGRSNPFKFKNLKFTATADESKQLNFFQGPCIIMAASGMCEAGRIRHHLKNNIENPANTIVIVGYMAEDTLGRRLVERMPVVKIFDEMYKVRSEIVVLNSFSAHADMNELDEHIGRTKGIKDVFVVHSEASQAEPFAERLKKITKANVYIPQLFEEYEI